MHCSRLSLALLLHFLVVPATAVPAAPAAPQAPGFDNALQLGPRDLSSPQLLAPSRPRLSRSRMERGSRGVSHRPLAKKRAFRALAPRSSPVAPRTGRIRINKVSDGSLIGYAAPSIGFSSIVGAKGTGSTDSFGLSISAAEGTTQAEIPIVSTPDPVYSNFFLGGQANGGGDLIAGIDVGNLFAGVPHTAPGSTSQRRKSTWSSMGVESSIFTIGPNSALTATWINSNGAIAPSFLCYYEEDDYLTLSSGSTGSACLTAVTWTFFEEL